jgi:hypothetical protein
MLCIRPPPRAQRDAAALALLLATVLAARQAAAEPGLADEVERPLVVAGATELSLHAGELVGGDNGYDWETRVEANYAYASWWRPGVAASWRQNRDGMDLSGLGFENVFDFLPSRRWPVHLGGYAEYERNMGEGPDHIELKLLMQHLDGPLDLRFNIITERELGENANNRWSVGYAAQAAYRIGPAWRLGVQGLGDASFDDQPGDINTHAQYWGPFAQARLARVRNQEISLQFGYLASSGNAEADGQARLQLEWSFNEDDDD